MLFSYLSIINHVIIIITIIIIINYLENGSVKASYKKRMSNNSLDSNPSSSHAKMDSQASENTNFVNMNSISEVNVDDNQNRDQ